MPKPNRQTADKAQAGETEITVDLGESDPRKAVQRRERPRADLAAAVNDREDTPVANWADRNKEVQKRLGRVTRTFEQKMADQQAEFQRQLTEERNRVDKLLLDRGGGDVAAADAAHDAKMKDLQSKLEAAIEAGNSADQAKITREMQTAEGKYWADKATAAGVATREKTRTTEGAREAQGTQRPGQPTAAGSRFILANEAWWDDPDFEVEKSAAGVIYNRLLKEENFSANEDETFAEVGRLLKAKFPDLEVEVVGKRRRAPKGEEEEELTNGDETRRAASGAIQDRGDGGASNRAQRRTLTAKEIQTMRSVDLDPRKNEHVLQFLREAQSYEALEGRP